MQRLDDRSILRVSGEDAEAFLQNVFTNDIRKTRPDTLQYSLLLTPQGQVLHDVFVFKDEGGFYIDVETARKDDLLKRLGIFRLRAKVAIEEAPLFVGFSMYAGEGDFSFSDPRYAALGHRLYSRKEMPSGDSAIYNDLCIRFGVPNGGAAIRHGKDFAHEVNLDHLNAFAWDKGCFIGQEVAARVHHRGLAKRRLMIVHGENLIHGEDIRQVDSSGRKGLAILRLDSLPEGAEIPPYLSISKD
jgi:folate-binding protein YgfZ